MTISSYSILRAPSVETLSARVCGLLQEGWQLHGGLVIDQNSYVQAMLKVDVPLAPVVVDQSAPTPATAPPVAKAGK